MKIKCHYYNFPIGPNQFIRSAIIRRHNAPNKIQRVLGWRATKDQLNQVYLTDKKKWYQLSDQDGIFPDFATGVCSDNIKYCYIYESQEYN
ncbi:MAG: hypothetical protein AABY22_05365 [Nanoarchaeota archaeon]